MQIVFYYNIMNYIIYSFFSCLIIDKLLTFFSGENARWFKLHACYNTLIVGLTCNEVIQMIQDPNSGFDEDKNIIMQGVYALMIHVYHCMFFTLKPIDYWHHGISVFIPGLLIPNLNTKVYCSLYFFIGTGLPGGIDYFCLTFYKYGHMSKFKQKKIAAYLNAYIRIPGGIIATLYTILDIKNETNIATIYSMYVMAVLTYLNVTYFGKMAIENYGENIYLNKNLKQLQDK